jgi:carbon monoxide dehydrogenase subunit G
MLKIIGIVVVVLLAAVLTLAATRPDSFRVQRAASIKAPPEKIFALINDFRSWGAWSPYEKKDPAMNRIHSGATSGKGAAYAWDGNKDIGQGRMEITDASPPSRVTIRLDFVRPFEAHNVVEFTLEPGGGATNVTWAMHGPSPYVAKLMGLFLNMDRMIGRDFEAGLANLKTIAEKQRQR